LFLLLIFDSTFIGLAVGVLLETINEMREELHSVALRQHIMNERLPKITEVFIITPSEYKKSKHKETFLDLMEMMFGFLWSCSHTVVASKIELFSGAHHPLKSAELDFTFRWEGQGQLERKKGLVPVTSRF
jgi:hypothetical protein